VKTMFDFIESLDIDNSNLEMPCSYAMFTKWTKVTNFDQVID